VLSRHAATSDRDPAQGRLKEGLTAMSSKFGLDSVIRFSGDVETFPAGQTIFSEGTNGEVMYVVKEGEVEVRVHGGIVETVGPGGILGEMALIDQNPRSATAVAKTDCTLVPVNEVRFKFLVQQVPAFSLEVMRVMASRLRKMDAVV
jgi:CRP/FNR family cyclic AMP-dependent transcriptional regulator